MAKYVVFIDILGFKGKLKRLKQPEAEKFIENFSTMLYGEWKKQKCHNNNLIKGFIVSDSVIIHTMDTSMEALDTLLKITIAVSKRAFQGQSILLRGAIAKGDFRHLEAVSFENLQKGLIVGQAYIEAYTLESATKTSAIHLTKDVYEDICNFYGENEYTLITMKINANEYYLLRWADVDFFLLEDNLKRFVNLAQEAAWTPHYYNTLYLFLYKNKQGRKADQVFSNIVNLLWGGNTADNWRGVDRFIENTFSDDVQYEYKQMFMRYLRKTLFANANAQKNV